MGHIYEFIANSSDGVFAVDRNQNVVLWNDRASEILGFTTREALGKKCYRILAGLDDRGCAICRPGCRSISDAVRLHPAPTAEVHVKTKQGDEVWLSVSTVVVPSRRRDLSVLIHLFRDVTHQHEVLQTAESLAEVVSGNPLEEPKSESQAAPDRETDVDLTRREREILTLLAAGTSTDLIAEKLAISPRTVQNHVNNVLVKLGVHSRLEAVACSIKNGLL